MSCSFKQRVLENVHGCITRPIFFWKAAKLACSVCRSPRHVAGDIRSSLPKEICPVIPPCYALEDAIPCFVVLSADLRGLYVSQFKYRIVYAHSLITWMHILI
ncbi:hypothetical protein V6N13_132498 [Hibiscus sabdariffa]|uniref:Uncharacterized protein n=1 Tax=Hibiscus sabdariffa TaxID=183260 RepID=A0ABR2PVI8_9ROSI